MQGASNDILWTKLIWKNCIPQAKTLVLWKFIMQNKLPTDDVLQSRGCNIVSRCDLCGCFIEHADHLILQCSFASKIWDWLEIKL